MLSKMNTRMTIKAITLWQSWATLVAIGAKQYETRSWAPVQLANSRSRLLAIHAAKKWDDDNAPYRRMEPFRSVLGAAGYHSKADMPLGRIVAVVEVGDVIATEEARTFISEQERAFGNYADGRFAWPLRVVYRPPVPILARGAQGIWRWHVPDEVALAI